MKQTASNYLRIDFTGLGIAIIMITIIMMTTWMVGPSLIPISPIDKDYAYQVLVDNGYDNATFDSAWYSNILLTDNVEQHFNYLYDNKTIEVVFTSNAIWHSSDSKFNLSQKLEKINVN
jgi:hypothetical protein